MITEDIFIKEVRKEINTIKRLATKEEINKLDINTFNPLQTNNCIYGQMTGNCLSLRAKELYPKSLHDAVIPLELFGIHKKGDKYTYLEEYLFHAYKATKVNIFKYLKGEVKKLKTLFLEK